MTAEKTCKLPRLVAHRGESAVAPENTLPAFQLAWRNKCCWAVETDVFLSADCVLVCSHDPSTLRTTGVDWRVEEKNFAELRTLDAGSFKGPMWHGVKLPSLQEVFLTLPPEGHIFVEIKSAGPDFARAFEEARLAGGVTREQVTIISFHADELKHVHQMLPDVRTLLLMHSTTGPDGEKRTPPAEEVLEQARALKVTGVDMEKNGVTKEAVKLLHDAGLEYHVWTVDQPDTAREMGACGVDSITTNRSRALYEELQSGK